MLKTQYTYFPKWLANWSIVAYFASLLIVSVLFMPYAMHWYWWLMGIAEILAFFLLSNHLTKEWHKRSPKKFQKDLFWWAFGIRVAFVLFAYWFFTEMTGRPYMFGSADEQFYNEMGQFGASLLAQGNLRLFPEFERYAGRLDLSDAGYPLYLSFIYFLTGNSLLLSRIIKALLSAYTCVLLYRLASRHFGEYTARMAAIFCMLMPNLLWYCGVQLKETEMVFLTVAFAERADIVVRNPRFVWKEYALALLLAFSLFGFRTVLGASAVVSLAVALLISRQTRSSKIRRWMRLAVILIVSLFFVGGKLFMQMDNYLTAARSGEQQVNMHWRSERDNGNKYAKYAQGSVFAPLIFTIPFPTLVETPEHENLRMMHAGYFIKNILSLFTIASLFLLFFHGGFLKGEWRQHLIPIALCLAYLASLTLSSFAQSERFHLPALPFELMFAAQGISLISVKKHKRYILLWFVLMIFASIGWNWFKLSGRGMI